MNGYTVIFQSLTNARNFITHTSKPRFIFALPDGRYLVTDARAANQLWADGHDSIR